MITRLQYFSTGVIFGVSLIYILREGFLWSLFIIIILSVIAIILMEKREYYYDEYLKMKSGE